MIDAGRPALSPRPRSDAAAVVALVVLATAIHVAAMARRPDLVAPINVLTGEEGVNLAVAACLLDGGVLYRDLSIPYGPLPSYAHAALASLLGNTIETFALYCHLASLAFLVVAYAWLRRSLGVGRSLLVAGLGLIPTMLIPGAPGGGGMNNAYTPFERLTLMLAILAWRPSPGRSAGRSLAIGGLLGLSQWAKFGGAFALGLPMAGLDALALLAARGDPAASRARLRASAGVFVGFLAAEAARSGLALAVLPRAVALDVIWPDYARAAYRAMLADPHGTDRFLPGWSGWRYFLGQQLNVVAALAAGLAGLVSAARRLADAPRDRPPLDALTPALPLLFYLAGALFYFGHAFIFMKYYPFLVLGATAFLAGAPAVAWGRPWVLGLAWLPAWGLLAKMLLPNPMPPDLLEVPLPVGGRVYLSAADRADLAAALIAAGLDLSRRFDPPAPVVFAPFASGLGVASGAGPPPRMAFLIPEYIRPYDVDPLARRLESARALVIEVPMTDDGLDRYLRKTFPPAALAILERPGVRRLRTEGRRTVFLLRRDGGGEPPTPEATR